MANWANITAPPAFFSKGVQTIERKRVVALKQISKMGRESGSYLGKKGLLRVDGIAKVPRIWKRKASGRQHLRR